MTKGAASVVYKDFEKVTDPRVDRGRNHDLHEMIFMALTANICGANGWADARPLPQLPLIVGLECNGTFTGEAPVCPAGTAQIYAELLPTRAPLKR
jgi:hypothetical protein